MTSVVVWYLVKLAEDGSTILWLANHTGVSTQIIETARHRADVHETRIPK